MRKNKQVYVLMCETDDCTYPRFVFKDLLMAQKAMNTYNELNKNERNYIVQNNFDTMKWEG